MCIDMVHGVMFHPNFLFQIQVKLISKFHSKFQVNINDVSASDGPLDGNNDVLSCGQLHFRDVIDAWTMNLTLEKAEEVQDYMYSGFYLIGLLLIELSGCCYLVTTWW